jgi:hypothetical protein
MRALGVARAVIAVAIATATACSIWAAIDDPYKSGSGITGAGDSSIKGPADAGNPNGMFAPKVIDAGFNAFAIAAYGDNTYALEAHGQVFAAYDASTRFTSFWTGDAGGVPTIQRNGIAASASGVFWTLSNGVRYCAIDGGACGSLVSWDSGAIAASDSLVAWVDTSGVRVCSMPVGGCIPTTLSASRSAAHLAAGPNGSVAWTNGGMTIHLGNGQGNFVVDEQYPVAALATDAIGQELYWQGPGALGFLEFDGGGSNGSSVLYSGVSATQLFAVGGVAYWSLANFGVVQYCRFDSSQIGCVPSDLQTNVRGALTFDGIVANSRNVLALLHNDRFSELIAWRVPSP